jgi:hypothetical protein
VKRNAGVGNNWVKAHHKKLGTSSAESPCSVAAFVVNSEPHTGACPSLRVCVEPELARCVHSSRCLCISPLVLWSRFEWFRRHRRGAWVAGRGGAASGLCIQVLENHNFLYRL